MTPAPDPRRHDLDALRAFAMLLGIALHAALSFMPIPWVVQDREQHTAFGVFVSAVHGFRMPLFFVLSGFFTAMMVRRRGLGGMLTQRVKRILLPLGVGVLTIVPLMWGVAIWAGSGAPTYGAHGQKEDLWSVARRGDLEALERFVEAEADLDQIDPVTHQSPLTWAVYGDQPAMVARLLELGADPDQRVGERNVALHGAAFFGRTACVRILLDAGADVHLLNQQRESPLDTLRHDQGTTEWIAGLLQIEIDWADVEAGRAEIEPLLRAKGTRTRAERGEEGTDAADAKEGLRQLAFGLMLFPFFHHLWFLWFLWWLVLFFFAVAWVLQRLRVPALPAWLVRSPLCWLWLVPLTWWPQSQMHMGGAMPGFGPDTSAGLLPMPHVFLYYAVFFGFGALYFSADDRAGRLGRWWWLALPVALLVLLPLGLGLAYRDPSVLELVDGEGTRRTVLVACQVLYAWAMTFGLMGLCRRMLSSDRPWIRYMSDSAYWLYLAHLPLVLWLQAVVRSWALPAWLKFTGITVLVTAVLLGLYQVMVRYTWIGRMLNGPRTRQSMRGP